MCNNLLQFAHVYAWGREHGRKTMSMRFSYKYKFFKISHSGLVSFPMYFFAKYAAALRILPTACFKYEDCDFEALERKMIRHHNIVVSGWFARWYDLFLKYRSEICDLFKIDERYTSVVKGKMERAETGCKDIIRLAYICVEEIMQYGKMEYIVTTITLIFRISVVLQRWFRENKYTFISRPMIPM